MHFWEWAYGEKMLLPLPSILSVMRNETSPTREPQRVHLHAYERLSTLCAEIQRGHTRPRPPGACGRAQSAYGPKRFAGARQRFRCATGFRSVKNGWYFTDPAWQLPSIALTQGELISFFAAERMLRRLGAPPKCNLPAVPCAVSPPSYRKRWL